MHGGAARVVKQQPDLPMDAASPSPDGADNDSLDAFRRRAVSEVVRNGTSRWRIVAAWSSLRRSWDSKKHDIGASDLDDSDTSNHALSLPPRDASKPSSPPSRAEPPPSALRPPRHAAPAADTAEQADRAEQAERAERAVPEAATETACMKDGEDAQTQRPRKRVSLFLRRRGRFRDGGAAFSANYGPSCAQVGGESGGESGGDLRQFRRAQSHLVKPVSFSDSDARFSRRRGEAGRYMDYAAEFDDDSFEALRDRTLSAFKKLRPAAIRLAPGVALESPSVSLERPPTPGTPSGAPGALTLSVSVSEADVLAESFAGLGAEVVTDGDGGSDEGEIIGEICLEDFADADSDDFEFLDGQIVDVWTEGEGDGKPSLRLDGQQIGWFGEKEFAAFCADVGLYEFFEVPKGPSEVELDTFRVGEELLDQWRDDGRIHNSIAARWGAGELPEPSDVRGIAMEG